MAMVEHEARVFIEARGGKWIIDAAHASGRRRRGGRRCSIDRSGTDVRGGVHGDAWRGAARGSVGVARRHHVAPAWWHHVTVSDRACDDGRGGVARGAVLPRST